MMTATFGQELIGLAVVDSRGDILGTVADLMVDLNSGIKAASVVNLLDLWSSGCMYGGFSESIVCSHEYSAV